MVDMWSTFGIKCSISSFILAGFGIALQRLTVQAIDNETIVYSLSLVLEEIR